MGDAKRRRFNDVHGCVIAAGVYFKTREESLYAKKMGFSYINFMFFISSIC